VVNLFAPLTFFAGPTPYKYQLKSFPGIITTPFRPSPPFSSQAWRSFQRLFILMQSFHGIGTTHFFQYSLHHFFFLSLPAPAGLRSPSSQSSWLFFWCVWASTPLSPLLTFRSCRLDLWYFFQSHRFKQLETSFFFSLFHPMTHDPPPPSTVFSSFPFSMFLIGLFFFSRNTSLSSVCSRNFCVPSTPNSPLPILVSNSPSFFNLVRFASNAFRTPFFFGATLVLFFFPPPLTPR